MRRYKGTLILLCIFIVLGVYAYFVEHKMTEKKEKEKNEKEKICTITEDEADSLDYFTGAKEILVSKKDNEWYIKKPVSKKADKSIISSFIKELNEKYKDLIYSGVDGKIKEKDLEQFGIKGNESIIVRSANKECLLKIGSKVRVGSEYYALLNERIVTVKDSIKNNFSKNVDEIRDKEIFSLPISDVKLINIKKGNKTIVEYGNEKGTWKIYKPFKSLAQESKVKGITGKIIKLKATGFTTLNKIKKIYSIFLETKTGSKHSFYLYKDIKKNIVYLEDLDRKEIFKVSEDLYKSLEDIKISEFRRKEKKKEKRKVK